MQVRVCGCVGVGNEKFELMTGGDGGDGYTLCNRPVPSASDKVKHDNNQDL